MDLQSLKGKVVEVFHKGKPTPVFVKDVKDKRLRVVFPSGKEELVNRGSLISYGKKPILTKNLSEILELLKEKNEKREHLKDDFTLEDVWEVVVDETEEIPAEEVCELALGRIPEDDEVAAFLRKVLEDKTYFKLKEPNVLLVNSRKEVSKLLLQKKKELERLKTLAEGESYLKSLEKGEPGIIDEEKRAFWNKLFKDYVLWKEEAPKGKLVSEVLKRCSLRDEWKLFEVLVKNGIFDEDVDLESLRTRFPSEFSEKALAQAEEIVKQGLREEGNRIDLTHLETFTVDAEETQDFDDAISVVKKGDTWEVYVHIAEVAGFVSPGTPLWNEALERASTLYLPERIQPMLPFSLSHEFFSLREGEVKPALTFKILLSENLEVKGFEPLLSLIKVKKRLTYEEVDNLIKEEGFWKELWQLFEGLKKKREDSGAIAVFLPEVTVRVEGDEIRVEKLEMTPARLLVAEAMILTNGLCAKFLFENQVPAVYRSQPKPMEVIENWNQDLFHKIMQLRYLSKSELSLNPGFHSGLGLEFYTTCTSPIRRFLDLVVQYQLKSFLLNKEPLSREELQKILAELSENLQRALLIQSKRHRYYLLKYLKLYKRNEVLRGLVTAIQSKKAKVYLIDYNLTGDLSFFKGSLSPGQEVQVKIDRVDPRQEVLRLKSA